MSLIHENALSVPATAADEIEIPWIVSVDDHVQEPPRLWLDRLPAKFRDIAPRTEREMVPWTDSHGVQHEDWGDVWYYESQRDALIAESASAGISVDDMDTNPITFDAMRPGTYDPVARLADMDLDHLEKSLCFPNTWVRFCGQRFLWGEDKELALLCVRAYNDFLVDEWQKPSNGRLLGVGIVPLWDVELAAAEVRRNAARGVKAVGFSELPARLGLPSLYTGYWEEFIRACDETGTVIGLHVGSSSTVPRSSDDAPTGQTTLCHFGNSALSLSDWMLSGALARHPNLRLMFSEGQAGWLPFFMGRLDRKWTEGFKWMQIDRKNLPELPSTYFERQVFACVTDDPAAVMFLDKFGANNICFETDYPHPDGSFPNSVSVARKEFGALSTDNLEKVIRRNALRLLGEN